MANVPMEPLILASASPRRRELLALLGVPFETAPSTADESVAGDGPTRVQLLSARKAEEVASRFPGRTILAADTLVCVEKQVLGKPRDEREAIEMLTLLSGRVHQVHTGVCLLISPAERLLEVCTTEVVFAPLPPETIRRYVATGEPMDKAGAYAIQGRAGAFVKSIHGSPSNVVGLPLETVARFFTSLNLPLFL